ncbi:MAG TPA: nuclear transport factor 2 family protein [Solirubrobacterales bacterium]|jgi:ketosteroid isomerase-like protein
MSAQDVELVRRWFSGFQRGDLSPEICDPEVVIRNWDGSPVRGPYHGHQGLEQWWADFAEVIEDVHMELKEVIDLDDGRVVTSQHLVGRFRLTGIEVDGPFGSIITVRDGKILSATGYATPGRAKKAAGLSRPGSGR